VIQWATGGVGRASIEGIVSAYIQANPQQQTVATLSTGQSVPSDSPARIEDVIRNYLLTQPEIMRDVFAALETKEELQRSAKFKTTMEENSEQLFGGTKGLEFGNPDGDVTLVEFFDYNCAFCKRALKDMKALLETDPNLKIIMKEYPILSEGSAEAARVSLAVAKQGRYIEFHKKLLGGSGQANGAKALRVAEELGMDMAQIRKDMGSPEVQAEIDVTQQLASDLGVRGTPAYVIGNELIPGAVGLASLRASIKSTREAALASN
ncbi:MAG: DsbA family protein, partial [Hyphomicrobiales bacterium]